MVSVSANKGVRVGFETVQKVRIRPGKMPEALPLFRQAHGIIIRLGCKANRVYTTDVGGEATGEVVFEYEFDSIEDWAAWRPEFFGDPEFQAMLPAIQDVLEPHSSRIVAMTELDLG